MTRRRFAIFAVIALLFSAVVLVGTSAGAPGAQKERPFKVSLEFTQVSAVPVDDCPNVEGGLGPFVLVTFEGGGNASHLGRVEVADTGQCNAFGTLTFAGAVSYVGANDDFIRVEYTGAALPTPDGGFTGDGEGTIVGGTGRFESASGEFDFSFETDAQGGTALDGEGWIAYDASNRRNR